MPSAVLSRRKQPALYGIIGYPLRHTRSPAMQQAAFDQARIPACYVPFEIPPRQLRRGLALLRRLGVAGFNVTVPHKERILRSLDRVDRAARQLGAVNTVVCRGSRWFGYNTDASGLLRAWRRVPRLRRRGATVLVLGAGGAARAVLWALTRLHVGRVAIANRTAARARALQRWNRDARIGLAVESVPWRDRQRWTEQHRPRLIVNATSLGLTASDALPLRISQLSKQTVIYDLAYRQPTTALITQARRRGLLAYDGRDMLLYQGAAAFELWTKRAAPVACMERALQRALSQESR